VRRIVWSSENADSEPAPRAVTKSKSLPGLGLARSTPSISDRQHQLMNRAYDDLIARLAGEDPSATANTAAAAKGTADSRQPRARRAQREESDSDDDDDEVNPRSMKALRRRLERRCEDLRRDQQGFKDLGKQVRMRTRPASPERGQRSLSPELAAGQLALNTNFLQSNCDMRPLSPERRSVTITSRAALDRAHAQRVVQTRDQLRDEHMALQIAHRDRRLIKKQAEAARRREEQLQREQHTWLLTVAAACRLQQWAQVVLKRRSVSAEEQEQDAAARVIQRYFRHWRFKRRSALALAERARAAAHIRKCFSSFLLRHHIEEKIKKSLVIKNFINEMSRASRFSKIMKTYRFKVVHIQQWWRRTAARRAAQLLVLDKAWQVTIKRKKQQRKDLSRQRDEAKEALRKLKASTVSKPGKPPPKKAEEGEVPQWLRLENELEACPVFSDKMVKQETRGRVLAEWGERHRGLHRAAVSSFLVEWAAYSLQMQELQAIILARRAMGALDRDIMPARPPKPFYRMLPREKQMLALIATGELQDKQGAAKRRRGPSMLNR